MDEKQIRLAAAWIYRNKQVGYWTFPSVLPQVQPDKYIQSLGLSENDAYTVFQALEDKSFLKKIDNEFVDLHGVKLQKYRVNWDKSKDYADLPFLDRYLPEAVIKFLEFWKTLLVGCFILIVTAFFQGVFRELGGSIFRLFTK